MKCKLELTMETHWIFESLGILISCLHYRSSIQGNVFFSRWRLFASNLLLSAPHEKLHSSECESNYSCMQSLIAQLLKDAARGGLLLWKNMVSRSGDCICSAGFVLWHVEACRVHCMCKNDAFRYMQPMLQKLLHTQNKIAHLKINMLNIKIQLCRHGLVTQIASWRQYA